MHAARPQAARLHTARHRRPVAPRARRLPLVAALLGLVVALAPQTTAASAQVLDPCGGNYTPVVTASTVNQGLGSYGQLVRGKTTLARLFLTAPSCAGVGTTVQLVETEVRVTEGTTVIGSAKTTPGALGPTFPTLPTADEGSGDDGPWNPLVRLPALGGDSDVTTASTLTFAYRLVFQYQTVPGGAFVTSTTAFRDVTTARMAPPTNPLRVLLVPMGDAGAPLRTQFPTAANGGTAVGGKFADQVALDAMSTVARTMPVADGVSQLVASTLTKQPGLQYELAGGAMVDLGPAGLRLMPSGGKVCMTAGGFLLPSAGPNVVSLLNGHLSTWNKANAGRRADRVVGLLWQGISGGTAGLGDGLSCAEGMANVNGTASFIRLLAPSTVTTAGPTGTSRPNPTMSGALATMELAHNSGAVVKGDRTADPFHSRNETADPGATRRAYDLSSARWVADPKSALRYTGTSTGYTSPSTGEVNPWNDTNVLLEQEDHAHLQCVLSASTLTTCPSGSVAGGATVAAATAGLVLAGTTDGTVAGTDLVSSYDAAAEPTRPDADSAYRLVLRDDAGLRVPACAPGSPGCSAAGDLGLRVSATGSVHDHEGDLAVPHSDPAGLSLYAAVAVDPRASRLEVWKGAPGEACTPTAMPAGCLYARARSTPPVVTTSDTGFVLAGLEDVSRDRGSETGAAVSPRGDAVAWQTATGLVVQLRDTTTGSSGARTVVLAGGREPAWSPSQPGSPGDPVVGELAYATSDGDIDRVTVQRSGSGLVFGSAVRVYDHLLQAPPVLGDARATSPSWSPTGDALAVAIGTGVWRISSRSTDRVACDLARLGVTSTCRPLVTGTQASDPDWGDTGGAGLVAYREDDPLSEGVWTVDPEAPTLSRRLRLPGADGPAFGARLLAHVQQGAVLVADPAVTDARGRYVRTTRLTSGTDSRPAVAREVGVLALTRDVGGLLGDDVHVGTVSLTDPNVSFTATTDGDPNLLRADVLLGCGQTQEPVLVSLRPRSTTGTGPGSASFAGTFQAARACAGGTLSASVSNGWDSSGLVPLRTYPVDGTPAPPTPTVTSPAPGTSVLQYDPIIGSSTSVDTAEGTNGGGTALVWTLTGPAGSGYTGQQVGTGTRLQVDPPVPGGHVPGTYVVSVTATGPSGATASASSDVVVLPDPSHLGVNATVTFNPRTLFVPSNGQTVSLRVSPQAQRLDRVPASTVRVVSVGGRQADLPVSSWTGDAGGTWTAKVDRQALSALISRTGLVGHYVQVVLSGGTGSDSFTGSDPRYPNTTPS